MSLEELQLENLRLQKEVEQLRDRLLVASTGRGSGKNGESSSQRVVGGGFRGSSLRVADKKGSQFTDKEVDTLRQVVEQKASKIHHLEGLVKTMKADAQSQERSLNNLQRCLSDATEQRQALERSLEELREQLELERCQRGQASELASQLDRDLESERRRNEEAERLAAEIAESKEELAAKLRDEKEALSNTRATLQAESRARKATEGRAAGLETELACALENAKRLEATVEGNQAEALRKLQHISNDRLELKRRYLVALGFHHSPLRLCWEAWKRSPMAEGLNRLHIEMEEQAARAALRSAAGRTEQSTLTAEIQRLRSSEEEVETLEAQLRSRESELEARTSELSEAEARAASLCAETVQFAEATYESGALDHELSELRASENRLRASSQELENQLQETQASCLSESNLAHEALEARDACVAREAALKTRAADLERRLEAASAAATAAVSVPATSSTAPAKKASNASALAATAEKQKQREETLLRDVKRAERERDEARHSLTSSEKSAAAKAARISPLEREVDEERRLTHKFKSEMEELQRQREQLVRKQASLESEARDQKRREKEKEDSATVEACASIAQAREQAASLRNELSEMKSEFGLASVDVKRLRQAREELQASLKAAREEASTSVSEAKKWKEAAEEAVKQVKSSLRILVTAPKVCINLGNNEFSLQRGAIPNDIEQIRGIVSERVLPAFQRIIAINEGEDEKDVRGSVMRMVEELAEKVQKEVYNVLPQAEGTTSWDGFGARSSSLR
jgi:chromosome segregation ATPase